MKGFFMHKFKKILMIGVTLGMLMASVPSIAKDSGGSWLGLGMSIFGTLYGAAMTFFNGGITIWMGATNVDPAQLVAESLVLNQMYHIKDEWEPEPQEEYQKAAESNGAGCSGSSGGLKYDSNLQKLPFQVAALKNVGIEAIGVGTLLSEVGTSETREKILEDLEWLQSKSSTTEGVNGGTEAGSCSAKYLVCSMYDNMTSEERDQVAIRQIQNEQNYGTAGIAHAELGLKSVQQAIVNDGDSSVGRSGVSSAVDNAVFVPGKTTSVQDLSKLIGTGVNTVAAMKIVAMMNLELAQRLNQGNMLQGSVLTIEAARAIPDTAELTD